MSPMRVYIRLGSQVENVQNIYLQNGYRPVVDGITPSASTSEGTFHIESALWYKTMLLDSVYIDCDSRNVYWLRKENTIVKTIDDEIEALQSFVPPGSERLHSDIDVYDFDPTIDELADSAIEIMIQYAEKKITWAEFRSEVTRLLHCYIFPAVKFNKDDIPSLQEAMRQIESKSNVVEVEIINKSQAVDVTDKSLQNLRNRILKNEQFDSELYVWTCKKEFLLLLYKDVEKDVQRLSSELEGIQLQVNNYRDCNVSEGTALKLQELRKRRNEYYELLVPLQTVRETLRNVLHRPSAFSKKKIRKMKIKENVFHDIYLEINERLQLQKDDLQRACLSKVKISSVREAIFSNISSLRAIDDEECPVRYTDGCEFSLDIIGFNRRPDDWKTLEEKVYCLLQDRTSDASRKHIDACKMIMDKIKSAIDDTKMFGASTKNTGFNDFVRTESLSSNEMQFVDRVGRSARRPRSGHKRTTMYSPDLVDEMSSMSLEALRKSMDGIKEDIKSQMESMCVLLIKSIPECEKRHKNKIWVSYENVFYLEILPYLCDLYELTHAAKSMNLFREISCKSLRNLIEENLLSIILRGVEYGIHTSPHPGPWRLSSGSNEEFELLSASIRDMSKSCVSLEIRKCTLQELYNMADQECDQLVGSIPNMFDISSRSPSVSDTSDTTVDEEESDVNANEIDLTFESEASIDPRELLSEMFSEAISSIQASFDAKTILEKLRRLTKVFRCLGDLLSDLNQNGPAPCCDEMLSMIIVMLRCLDEETFVRLYASIQLLIDLRAPFLNGSVHDCSLTNFYGAFDYLFNDILCKRERPESGQY